MVSIEPKKNPKRAWSLEFLILTKWKRRKSFEHQILSAHSKEIVCISQMNRFAFTTKCNATKNQWKKVEHWSSNGAQCASGYLMHWQECALCMRNAHLYSINMLSFLWTCTLKLFSNWRNVRMPLGSKKWEIKENTQSQSEERSQNYMEASRLSVL